MPLACPPRLPLYRSQPSRQEVCQHYEIAQWTLRRGKVCTEQVRPLLGSVSACGKICRIFFMVTWCCTPFLFSGHPNNASLVMVMLFIFIKNILIRSVRGSFASVNTSWVGCIIGFDPEPETRKPEPCPYIFYPAFSWDVVIIPLFLCSQKQTILLLTK